MHVYHSICTEKLLNALIEMLFSLLTLKLLNSIKKIQPRMTVATCNSNQSTTIFSYYSPINASDETDLIPFYNELSSLVCSISKHNVLIIGGNMNAQIDKDENKNCLHNLSNRNEEHLTEFSLENRLTCLNTKFQRKDGKLWTFTNTKNAKAQID